VASDASPIAILPGAVRLALRLMPGSRGDQVDGLAIDAAGQAWLKIRVSAPPVDGKANQALVKFLAKRYRLPKTSIEIISGTAARNKIVALKGDPEALQAAIEADL
jgi:uncharacterized protein (TIGR00251 family)